LIQWSRKKAQALRNYFNVDQRRMGYLSNFPRTIYSSECAVFRGGLIKTDLLSFGANGLHAGDVDQEQNTNH
jgi:hypothetical protein